MIIYPAIDLKDSNCVRLKLGKMEDATIFHHSPVEQAKNFISNGFEWLHIVDLNGAFAGRPVNSAAIQEIILNVNIPIQLGGGIRDLKTIEYWLSLGISRVIIGTLAVTQPDIVKQACKLFPGRIILGVDAINGKVATDGWAKETNSTVIDLANNFSDCDLAAIIYTDIGRDGILVGPDIEGIKKLLKAVNIPVIASGGVARVSDLAKLKELEADGLMGAIVGRAIYDEKILPWEALKIAKK
ncbi:MAG: 1-(5-phosphoribosyl)-5-[(5-phosphoribosylamino)methylideneamino]imidazole-4-carboxamide isomerase [Pseudomonadota bacterium]